MEKDGLQALSDALATNAEYVFAKEKEDDTLDDWLDELKDEPKNYKIFRKIFNKNGHFHRINSNIFNICNFF